LGGEIMEPDFDKIDNTVLALLYLTLHDEVRAWKGFDFDVMDRLFEKGYILDPRNKTKSVILTEKGLEKSKELFTKLFTKGS
jgi:predicted GNAT superfamily acetyltransferase